MELLKERLLPNLASVYECTACLACENVCPKHAIGHYLAEDGHVYVKVDASRCIGCLKCQMICEKSRSYYGSNVVSDSKIYAGWTKDALDRANATSGGVFAAFSKVILDFGGCVVGASLNGFECKHTVIYKKEDVYRLQGSKYMASSMDDVYKIIKKELLVRDVLFAGLGCQCAAVKAFFDEYKTEFKLYTIDLVCGGVPSRILIETFRRKHPNVVGFVSFRSKDKYELTVRTKEGTRTLREKSLPLHGFNCAMTNRYSCYNCQFAKAHRLTDITIGDLWDYSILPEEHKQGISMLIIHSENGGKLLKRADVQVTNIDWEKALLQNKRTVCAKQNVYNPRKELVNNSRTMKETRFFKLYTITMTPVDIDLFIFRLYRYVQEKLLSNKNKSAILKMIQRGSH